MKQLGFCWGVSSFYGWGVYGMNLALQVALHHPEVELVCGLPFDPADVVVDPLREHIVGELAQRSRRLWEGGNSAYHEGPVLHALMGDMVAPSLPRPGQLAGVPPIGISFIEEATVTEEGKRRARDYAVIIAGSTWNADILRGHGIFNTALVLQGVDTSIFHPAPRAGLFRDRFVIFSGGKLEFRKGQDIVLAAFREFHHRHPEALLVAAWGSPWPHLAAKAIGRHDIEPMPTDVPADQAFSKWAFINDIPAGSFVCLPQTPNIAMPHIIRECDVALFPNRAEGGTNLVAMECMACGIPTILSANTGHLDLMEYGGDRLALAEQTDVKREGVCTDAWGESNIEEIVDRLESVWRRRDTHIPRDDLAMRSLTWRRQINRLLREVEKVT